MVAGDEKAVRKAGGDPQHALVRVRQQERSPLAEVGELRRISTATSYASPAVTRTSFPCGCRTW
jgi:hypothetical protein